MAEPTRNKWGGNQNGINFDATAEIPLSKAASLLMPQTKNGSVLEPHISDNRKMAPIRSQKQKNMKNIHKNRVFVLYPLREKKEILSKWFSFGPSRCLPDGRRKILSKNLIFSFSRDLPLEGRKLRNRHNFWSLPVGTSEEILETGKKALFSLATLWGKKFFESTPPNDFSHWE